MKTIWYFVGLMLSIMGAAITISGVYHLIDPPAQKQVLGELHADIWWGAIMLCAGIIFLLTNLKKEVA